ncbi:MAG: sigma 54-interacting transcriptional regulator [Syntrophomonadaceae bacterium]|nr:sigma 54-interacting transcriptional regulator [Syntrophomonadaceae bacterium]
MKKKLGEILSSRNIVLHSNQTINEGREILIANQLIAAPVVDDQKEIVGVVTEGELIQAKNVDPDEPITLLMNKDWSAVSINVNLEVALKAGGFWIVAVDEHKTPIGVLSKYELVDAVIEVFDTTLKRLHTVMDSAHNGIIALDKDGLITHYNSAAEVMFGFPQDKAIGRHIKEVDPESTLMDVVQTGQAQMVQKRKLPQAIILTNRRPILRNGEIIGVVAVFQDLSEVEAAHNELRSVQALNHELESILKFSHDGLAICDGQGRFLRVSPSFSKLLGIPDEELTGRAVSSLSEEGQLILSVIQAVINRRAPVSMTQNTSSGQQILATSVPVFDELGQLVRVVTNLRDMTELNDLREQVQQTSELSRRYLHELEEWRARFVATSEVIASSETMQRAVELALHVAKVDSTVLITGESGVGKQVIAKMIHRVSPRRDGPFIEINCGAIPETLLESELFGYERGAFTGAAREGRTGIFELANNGTLLLDEIGEIPLNLQVKLLRAIQEQEIYRVGGSQAIKLNVRIIAATNKNLWQMVQNRQFREDLYYRLNVVPMEIPPLRKRRDDIIPLTNHFLKLCNDKYGFNRHLEPEVYQVFERYNWPGNARELQNLVERLVVTCNADIITEKHLPASMSKKNLGSPQPVKVFGLTTLKEAGEIVEKELVTRALRAGKSTRRAAELLGVTHSTVIRKLKQYNITPGTQSYQNGTEVYQAVKDD